MPDDQTSRRSEAERGREAERPQDIPAPGWKDVAWRVWNEISKKNIFLVSGGVSYSVLVALFPGLAAMVSIYGLLLDPGQIEKQVGALAGILPDQSRELLSSELHQLASASSNTLGLGAIIGLLLALWTASRGMSGMMSALDIAYEEEERRSFIRFNLIALVLTLGAIIGGLIAVTLVAILPAAVQFLGLDPTTKWLLLLVQWPILIVLLLIGLAVLYRYGPDREKAQWHWVSPGAIVATLLWIIASVGFTVYVANFSSYDKTYGSLGGAVIMLTWLYMSTFVVLLGAVINAQSERQTKKDTTSGAPKPMGRRGAYAADTVGPSSNTKAR